MKPSNSIAVVILAAGKGTRLNKGKPSPKPKVLFKIAGKPMVIYTISNLDKLKPKKIVVVTVAGKKGELVKKTLGQKYHYAIQRKQLGTAHAALCGIKKLNDVKTVLVINGDDSAFYNLQTLENLVTTHLQNKNILTFLTLNLDNPTGLGRVLRDQNNHVLEIIEEKVASKAQKKIKEVNVGCYIADLSWLRLALTKIKKSQVGEYYLVDIVKIAVDSKAKVNTVQLNSRKEWQGVNTPQELAMADLMMRKKLE